MISTRRVSILLCGAALIQSCSDASKHVATPSPTPQNAAQPAEPPLEACALLLPEEIKSVQGEPPSSTKPTLRTEGKVAVSLCFFALPNTVDSVSLAVYQKGVNVTATTAKDRWAEIFSPEKLQDTTSASGKPKLAPTRVTGLGDEAFWTGDDRISALHVLKGERFFLISVGGVGDREAKLEKSKRLAEFITARL